MFANCEPAIATQVAQAGPHAWPCEEIEHVARPQLAQVPRGQSAQLEWLVTCHVGCGGGGSGMVTSSHTTSVKADEVTGVWQICPGELHAPPMLAPMDAQLFAPMHPQPPPKPHGSAQG